MAVLVGAGACSKSVTPDTTRIVPVVKVARANLSNTMTLQAEFEPYQDVLLHGKVSGYIKSIPVDIGDRVKAGDLIATIEVPELAAQLESALAAEKRAQSEYTLAHLEYQRLQEVIQHQPSLVAQQDIDAAQAKDLSAAAAVASAKADADRYNALVSYTRITAPFDGVITKRFVDVGALVQAGTSSSPGALVELAEDDKLRLRFPVPEAETPDVRVGDSVQVTVDAVHRTFSGQIARDAGAIDRATRTMLTEVDVPNPDRALRSGMYASIVFPLQVVANALTVPLQSLSVGEHPSVWLVTRDGELQERSVVVGLRTANRVEIKSGLTEGEEVVVGARSGLQAGEKVFAKDEDALALQ